MFMICWLISELWLMRAHNSPTETLSRGRSGRLTKVLDVAILQIDWILLGSSTVQSSSKGWSQRACGSLCGGCQEDGIGGADVDLLFGRIWRLLLDSFESLSSLLDAYVSGCSFGDASCVDMSPSSDGLSANGCLSSKKCPELVDETSIDVVLDWISVGVSMSGLWLFIVGWLVGAM